MVWTESVRDCHPNRGRVILRFAPLASMVTAGFSPASSERDYIISGLLAASLTLIFDWLHADVPGVWGRGCRLRYLCCGTTPSGSDICLQAERHICACRFGGGDVEVAAEPIAPAYRASGRRAGHKRVRRPPER